MARPCGFGQHLHLSPESEGPKELFDAGTAAFGPNAMDKPSVVCFDATCRVTPSLVARNGKHRYRLPEWSRTLMVVPEVHQNSHKLSHAWCQSKSTYSGYKWLYRPDGSARFNGTKFEQLFSTLNGLESILRTMRSSREELLLWMCIEENNLRVFEVDRANGKRVHFPSGSRIQGPRQKRMRMTGPR